MIKPNPGTLAKIILNQGRRLEKRYKRPMQELLPCEAVCWCAVLLEAGLIQNRQVFPLLDNMYQSYLKGHGECQDQIS